MHHSDFIVVEKRLAKAQKELADETKRREGLERRCDELFGWVAARDRRIAELEAALKVIERRLRFPCNDTEKSMRDVARAALAGKEQENG